MYFASDNWAGAAPEIVAAIAREAERFGTAYGDGAIDREAEARFSSLFEREVAVLFVGTGSVANGLALASVARPGGVVFCHRESHIIEDECGGVEFLTGAARLLGIGGPLGKIGPAALRHALARFAEGHAGSPLSPRAVHAGQPMAVSLSQMTESGAIYEPDEIEALAAVARQRSLPVHMDGARFANAVAHLGVTPAELTWKAGIDVLSFGGTKNGCVAAEAIVFFDPAKAAEAPYLRKRAGQLFSKSRFIAAQFDAYLRDGLWLKLAARANAMADRLRAGLTARENARLAWPTHGNEIFAVLKRSDAERLQQGGARFYDWPAHELTLPAEEGVYRLVTAFATRPADVEAFLTLLSA